MNRYIEKRLEDIDREYAAENNIGCVQVTWAEHVLLLAVRELQKANEELRQRLTSLEEYLESEHDPETGHFR